jgi:hypothetical protein
MNIYILHAISSIDIWHICLANFNHAFYIPYNIRLQQVILILTRMSIEVERKNDFLGLRLKTKPHWTLYIPMVIEFTSDKYMAVTSDQKLLPVHAPLLTLWSLLIWSQTEMYADSGQELQHRFISLGNKMTCKNPCLWLDKGHVII